MRKGTASLPGLVSKLRPMAITRLGTAMPSHANAKSRDDNSNPRGPYAMARLLVERNNPRICIPTSVRLERNPLAFGAERLYIAQATELASIV